MLFFSYYYHLPPRPQVRFLKVVNFADGIKKDVGTILFFSSHNPRF